MYVVRDESNMPPKLRCVSVMLHFEGQKNRCGGGKRET